MQVGKALVVAGAVFMGIAGVSVGQSEAAPIAAAGTEGFKVIVSSTDDVIARYEGTTASFTSLLYLDNDNTFLFNNQTSPVASTVNLGSFAIGTELIFRLEVDTGDIFFSGDASRNPDGKAHARVEAEYEPGTTLVSFEDLLNGPFEFNDLSFTFSNTTSMPSVPEPATLALLGAGLLSLGLVRRRQKG